MPGTVLGSGDTTMSKMENNPHPHEAKKSNERTTKISILLDRLQDRRLGWGVRF